jgi:homoserine dehydrogenase
MSQLNIAIAGLGTVGTGVVKILQQQCALIKRRTNKTINIKYVVVRDADKGRDVDLPAGVLTSDLNVLSSPDVDVVLELMGGTTAAREVVMTALNAGKDVITANKALLCQYGDEVFRLARDKKRTIAFEAAVAGGVPIIEAVGQSLASNQITLIEGILNGTCNFILTEMFQKKSSYSDAVKLAQSKGYAEADPSMDVDGIDAAQKLTILTQLAFGTKVSLDQFLVEGISPLDLTDLHYANELGYRVKLLGSVKLIDGKLAMQMRPTLIKQHQPMADIVDAYNMIEIEGDAVGRTWFSGMGAGQMATASAVVSDLISVAVGRAQLTFPLLDLWQEKPRFEIMPLEKIERRFYLRLSALDKPGTMAEITHILGKHGISIASLIQYDAESQPEHGTNEDVFVPLVIMTHKCQEGQLRAADAELSKNNRIRKPIVHMVIRDC